MKASFTPHFVSASMLIRSLATSLGVSLASAAIPQVTPSIPPSLPPAPPAAQTARVERFTPVGQVKTVRQITARFSAPIVPFGDPRLEAPFTIACPEQPRGHAHWVDAKNWVYDFDADLPAGIQCAFTVREGLKTLAGARVQPATYRFTTGGPAIRMSWPREGEYIDDQQNFLLGLDAPAHSKSVSEHAFCSVAGIGERIPLTVIEGGQRLQILEEQRHRVAEYFAERMQNEKNSPQNKKVNKKILQEAPGMLVVQCARPLPPDATVNLVWDKGIRTENGIATHETQTLPFTVRSSFKATQRCTRINPKAGCVPVLPITVDFSSPVPFERAAKIRLIMQDGQAQAPKLNKQEKSVETITFDGPFPANTTVTLDIPQGLTDDALRKLSNASVFPLKIRIDDDPPLIKFPSHFGILESNAQPLLPVSVRNVEASLKGLSASPTAFSSPPGPQSIQNTLETKPAATPPKAHPSQKNQKDAAVSTHAGTLARIDTSNDGAMLNWLQRVLTGPHHSESVTQAFQKTHNRYPREGELPLLHGHEKEFQTQPLLLPTASQGKALELIGIPLPKPGFYVVEFASKRLGAALHQAQKPYYAYSSALVTNLSVHFKKGRESSLVWVTQLNNAQPAANVHIQISDCTGKSLWKGETDKQGLAPVNVELPDTETASCDYAIRGYFITARKENDLSFTLSNWNEGLRPWQFNLGGGKEGSSVIAHTVLDRPLFRAGETVSMKHFVRLPTGKGFDVPKTFPDKVEIRHQGSDQTYEVPVQWSNGAGRSTWSVPREAKLGGYQIALRLADTSITSGSFRIEQFRVPLLRALLKPPAKPVIQQDKLDIDAQLSYLSGGPSAGMQVKFRSQLNPYTFSFTDYDDFTFGGHAPKEGIKALEPYSHESEQEQETEEPLSRNAAGYPVRTQNVTLDEKGGARVTFNQLPKTADAHTLDVEMEYADPNGQRLTASTQALVLPSSLILGLRVESHQATRERLAFKVIALDPAGKIQPQRSITVDAYLRTTYSYRKRLLGGFYAYEQTEEVKRVGTVCKGKTDPHGLLVCDDTAPEAGELILVAKAKDAEGYATQSVTTVHVAGEDSWYSASSNDRIDLLPDRRAYEPGETAHFEVRMPFREATALVTVEREGVLDSRVIPISAESPFVDVPILEHYGPNAYVSVMVVRGRIDPVSPGRFAWLRRMMYRIGAFLGLTKNVPRDIDTHPTALVDLTKPAFKLGITPIRVGWKGYELKVKVEPERPVYKVRDRASVMISVTDPGGKPAAHAEIALAAVDEGLLSLAPATSWNLLDAMMERRALEVETSTAQSHIIGKRHFGKKAVAPGGGGGSANARELFDTLLVWHPVIQLDEHGRARVEVPLNDSLTSFRIEAIAHTGTSYFGSGHTSIRTTQDVMLFAGLPPFIREGDDFNALVTVRNGSERPLTLEITAQVNPNSSNAVPLKGNQGERVSLQPGKATEVVFPYTVPFDKDTLNWTFTAREVIQAGKPVDKPAQDSLKFVQQIGAAYPVRVYQQTLEQLQPNTPWALPLQIPKGALPGRGGIDITLTASLGGNIASIHEWVKRYPYSCMEQQASLAIALEDQNRWESVMNKLGAYLDHDGLARYFPNSSLEGSDSLSSYLLTIAHEANWTVPDSPRKRMLKGLQDFVSGRIHRYGYLPTADLTLRKIAAIDALARYAEANPKMLESIEINPNLWPTSGVIDWISLLSRMPDITNQAQKLSEARQILRSRLMFSGTTLTFSQEKSDNLWWVMVSPDVNAVRTLRLLGEDPDFDTADVGRLARGALARQKKGHWDTTVANAWGVLALRHFQKHHERDPVAGISLVKQGEQIQTLSWSQAQPLENPAPFTSSQLHSSSKSLTSHVAWPSQGIVPFSLEHQGSGKPWAFLTSRAALPLDKPVFTGYRLTRTLTPIDQKTLGTWSRGDIYRVTLSVDAQTDMTWVVVNDPIPAGATILGTGLGGDSKQQVAGEKQRGSAYPAFEERAFDGFRAYYAYVPKGQFTVEYTVRLNNPGRFQLPAARVEALYAPGIFGELPVARLEVQ